MDIKAFDFHMAEDIKLKTVEYPLNPTLWKLFDLEVNLGFDNWVTYKYLDENGERLNNELDLIPNNKGGVYLFFVKCPIMPGISEFPFYIGRAFITEYQSLRKRIKEYYHKYKRGVDRPKSQGCLNIGKMNCMLVILR